MPVGAELRHCDLGGGYNYDSAEIRPRATTLRSCTELLHCGLNK